MNNEDALHFVQERLRREPAGRLRPALRLGRHARLVRRLAVQLGRGESRVFECADHNVRLRCARGSLWITHDGDPKDVILGAQDSYRAEREAPMHVFALQPCVLEIEFEDDALPA